MNRLRPPSWLQKALINFAWFVVALIIYFGVRAWQQQTLVEGTAPGLRSMQLDGQSFDLEHFRGRPVLVYFWATWCAVCRVEQDNIEALNADLPVVGVALQSGSPEKVRAYMRENGLRVAVLNDPDGAIAAAWGVRATPTGFVIDPNGRIRFREVGYTSEWGWRLRMWWAGHES